MIKRVQELTRQGLWSAKRFPKVCERPRGKAHWDFVLQETQWLAVDFYQEWQWKRAAAKMLAYSAKDFVEKKWEIRKLHLREKHERELRTKASFVAGQIRAFWDDVAQLKKWHIVEDEVSEKAEKSPSHLDKGEVMDSENEVEVNGMLSDCDSWEETEDESTISEQERHELEEFFDPVQELKALASDNAQPLQQIIPEDYTMDSDFSVKEFGEVERAESDHSSEGEAVTLDDVTEDEDDVDDWDDLDSHDESDDYIVDSETMRIPLTSSQRKLYDDFLAKPSTQEIVDHGDDKEITKIIGMLRRMCNHPCLLDSTCHAGKNEMEFGVLFILELVYTLYRNLLYLTEKTATYS